MIATSVMMCKRHRMEERSRTSNHPVIAQRLEQIYALFEARAPAVIEGCPCCVDRRNVDPLLTRPSRDLTGDDLRRYVSSVFLTLGAERDFRYLLPRILELAILDPGALPDVEIILGNLSRANWKSWAKAEREAIEGLVDVWFECAFQRDLENAEDWLADCEAEHIMCGAARAGLDITRYCEVFGRPEAEALRAFLADRYARALARNALPSCSFWEDAPEGWSVLAKQLSV